MPSSSPPWPQATSFRFGLPPSLGPAKAHERAQRLETSLAQRLGQRVEVSVAQSYDGLAKDVLAGRLDAAWAPPFVCARLEAMGVRVMVRGVRRGASSYRAALVTRAGVELTLEQLAGRTAAWVDKDSVGGYLLATALLRARGVDPSKAFFAQSFVGSYQGALEAVLSEKADVTSVFAPVEGGAKETLRALEELVPGASARLCVVAYTDVSPNDGVAVSMSLSPERVAELEHAFVALDPPLLKEVFNAERFEPAPRLSYRALYRVALVSL